MKRVVFGVLVVVMAAVVVAGCSQIPPTHYYVLELDPAPGGGAASVGGAAGAPVWSVGVRPFAVDAPYDQDRIVYRVGEGSAEVGFYAYHLWAAPLSSMLPAVVATGLEGGPGAAVVEPVVAGRTYRAFINGRVLAVEEIDLPDRQLVRAEIELRLVAPDGAELWAGVVDARGETRTEQVGDVVEALSVALADALARTREELGRIVASLGR